MHVAQCQDRTLDTGTGAGAAAKCRLHKGTLMQILPLCYLHLAAASPSFTCVQDGFDTVDCAGGVFPWSSSAFTIMSTQMKIQCHMIVVYHGCLIIMSHVHVHSISTETDLSDLAVGLGVVISNSLLAHWLPLYTYIHNACLITTMSRSP